MIRVPGYQVFLIMVWLQVYGPSLYVYSSSVCASTPV